MDFQSLVRQSGIVFTADVGQGPEEWVLAIASPNLARTQVATQADLVAAGYIRQEALVHLEAERERLTALLHTLEEQRASLQAQRRGHDEALAELERRVRRAEIWRQAEHEGVVARNRGDAPEANPYRAEDEVDELGGQAWRHGWRVRDTLIGLNDRIRSLQAALDQLQAARDQEHGENQQRLAEAQSEQARWAAAAQQAQTRIRQLEVEQRHLPALEEALRLAWTEAPHSPACAVWAVGAAGGDALKACDCWRARIASEALSPFAGL
ncbi:MAG: hypothetical protein VKP62_11465 [Candidatus Sericytochromatia bacterium]|nr:hypothetical protein [Candidatus Sericytochromatia bacterium]